MCFCIVVEHLVHDVADGKGQKLGVAHLFVPGLLAHAGHHQGIGGRGQGLAIALRVAQGILRADAAADQGGQQRFTQEGQADLKALTQAADVRPLLRGLVEALFGLFEHLHKFGGGDGL